MSKEVFKYRVGFLGCPSQPDVEWNDENVRSLKDLGFNTFQLNIAWGARPADEPLNLEDVIDFPVELREKYAQPVPLRGSTASGAFERRQSDLRHRIEVCKRNNVRTLFHFGAPYNAHCRYGDAPPNCLMDGKTPERNAALVEAFADAYPGVDDLWLYTYDQDAWLCDEFGPCPRCRGIPLHIRVTDFVNLLARTWSRKRPGGRLWWEPWELSAGQVLKCIDLLDKECVGLALHSNIAEVQATQPVDRWLKVTCRLAKEVGIPVIVEHFLGCPTEEMEPFRCIPYPLVTLRALRAIAELNVDGAKEYYGLVPTKEDANLRMTGLFFENPAVPDAEALAQLAVIYGDASEGIVLFWKLLSEGMDLFPWYTSWYIRKIGKCNPSHSMSAAFIRGQQAHTPSWDSTRSAVFMKTDDRQPDPWMLEDVQLQCEMCAERLDAALEVGKTLRVPVSLKADLDQAFEEVEEWRRRTLSYAYHLRETNLARMMRLQLEREEAISDSMLSEMKSVLVNDMANQGTDEPCKSALVLLNKSVNDFLAAYFVVSDTDTCSRGGFTVTSR